MSESNSRNDRFLRMIGGLILLALIVPAITFFYHGKPQKEEGTEYAFNGWLYDRETQKEASAALAKAGLHEFSWKDGKLSIPKSKEGVYESILAESRIFPKAPSDVKRDILREMGPFESESKIRMRDLYSAAWQLEQTIEQFSTRIEYATVGVRSRREQIGLIPQNIITASVGVWPKEEKPLSRELISAITLATRHHLGIADDRNISIIDLRQGRSWLGTVEGVQDPSVSVFSDELRKEEENWQKKFQTELGYIPGLRISTTIREEKDLPVQTAGHSIAVLGHPVPGTFVSHYPSSDRNQKIFRNSNGNARSLSINISIPEDNLQYGNTMDPEGEKARIIREIRARSANILLPFLGKDQLDREMDRILRISFFRNPVPKIQTIAATKIPAPDPSPILPQYNESVDPIVQADQKEESRSPVLPKVGHTEGGSVFHQWKTSCQEIWNRHQKEVIGGLILFLFSLFLVRSVIKRGKARRKREMDVQKEISAHSFSQREDPRPRSGEAEKVLRPDFGPIQQEVRELIEQNPEQAARIIQRWIRTGA